MPKSRHFNCRLFASRNTQSTKIRKYPNVPAWSIVWQVKLLLKEELDRESEAEYRMRLFAVDGGADAMTGSAMVTASAMVTVHVIDVNDNRPRFSKPLYEVFLPENTPAGTVVITVDAFDDDEGQNGVIDFQFAVSTQESSSSDVFSINNSTGQIVVKVATVFNPLSHEHTDTILLL